MNSRYYTRTFIGMTVVFAAIAAAAVLTNSVAGRAKSRFRDAVDMAKVIAQRSEIQRAQSDRLAATIGPVHEFAVAWRGTAQLPEKNAAERIRSELETIAQRQLGLVTDNAITPQPERYSFDGISLRVQRVTLRASGKDLTALMTWLGKVEEKYPAAVVEYCELLSNVGGNTALTVRLVQPLEAPVRRLLLAPTAQDINGLPDAIAAVPWLQYLPARLKGAIAVGFQRNPLQPAVVVEQAVVPLLHDDGDELAPRVETALDGRVRSVIRGASPIVVIDGRVFRIGDELVIGREREKPVPNTKIKLKRVGEDRLVLQVTGGTSERPIQCDVSFDLPSFLRAR